MAQVVKLKRSSTAGNAPTSGQMVAGELAMNTADGKLFLRDDSDIRPIVTVDNEVTGSINLIGNITASGNISASGNIYGGLSLILDNETVLNRAGGSGLLDVGPDSDFTTIRYGKNGNPNHDFRGNITASSNISSSGTSDNFFGGRLVLDNSKYVAGTAGGTTRNILGIDGSFVTQVANSQLATNIKGTSISIDNALTVDTGNITVTNGNVHLDTNNTQLTGKLTGGVTRDLIGFNASDSVVVGNTTADSITLVGNTELQGNLNISQTTNSNVIITGSITHKFPDATYTYQGELSPLAGTLLTAGEVYHYSGSGWIVADASDDTATKHLGVAVSATEVMIRGYIRNTVYAGLGTGNVLYLSTTAGDVTITPPSTAGEYVRVLGYCVEGTTRVIYFNPSQDWIEL